MHFIARRKQTWDRLPCERPHARIFFSLLLHFFTFYFDGLKTFWSPQGSPRMFCLTTGGYILLHCTFSISTPTAAICITLPFSFPFLSGFLPYLSLYQHVHFGSLLGHGAFRPSSLLEAFSLLWNRADGVPHRTTRVNRSPKCCFPTATVAFLSCMTLTSCLGVYERDDGDIVRRWDKIKA